MIFKYVPEMHHGVSLHPDDIVLQNEEQLINV